MPRMQGSLVMRLSEYGCPVALVLQPLHVSENLQPCLGLAEWSIVRLLIFLPCLACEKKYQATNVRAMLDL